MMASCQYFGTILSRAGLTSPTKKKRRTTPYSEPSSEVTAPNQLWCMDFKGYFMTGNGTQCDPFTITHAHSRYLIRCKVVSRMDLSQVQAICEAAMREYGLPSRIRTENGAPFAGTGLLGLSKLSLGWMKMGIVHERVQPGDRVFISEVFRFEEIGLEEVEDRIYKVFLREVEIGELDVEALRFRPVQLLR
jgi:hypothetical protein